MQKTDTEKILKAGKITKETRDYAKTIVKQGTPLVEIAEKIESKIVELGGKPAFPVNLSINEIAAHYTPDYDDKTLAHGLLKVDFGVHIDGWPADNSISFDLENSDENKKLIKASEEALKNALEIIKEKTNTTTDEVGETIQNTIESYKVNPIVNLCGHSMKKNELHAGITIPNINDGRGVVLKDGLYAIEPFATGGSGKVKDGKFSGIYELKETRKPRSPLAREVLEYIYKNYSTLPFCSRWIHKKFGARSKLALNELESNGNLYQFSQLVEVSGKKVGQAEHSILIDQGKVIVTTL